MLLRWLCPRLHRVRQFFDSSGIRRWEQTGFHHPWRGPPRHVPAAVHCVVRVDLARRAEMLGQATTKEETKRAERFSVRGLRPRQNEECAVYHTVGVHDTDVDATY